MTEKIISPTKLEVIAVFGFDGHVPAGIKIHLDQHHICFPLGNKITILNMTTDKEEFLSGHSHSVTTLAISECKL
jgi:cilia- and flagella-associated protein 52